MMAIFIDLDELRAVLGHWRTPEALRLACWLEDDPPWED